MLNYTLNLAQPEDENENGYQLQSVTNVTYSPDPTIDNFFYGQPWAVWQGGQLSGADAAVVTATITATVTTHVWNYDQSTSGSVASVPSSLKQQYLHDEWKIDADNSTIVSLAHSIVGNDTNVYSILQKIYVWMLNNIQYPSIIPNGEPKSALETLNSRVGKCDEQSFLFVSLARAEGVPAWLQLGELYNGAENSWAGHAWVEAFVPNKEGGGDNVTIDVVNKEFLVYTPDRILDFTDDGNASHLCDYYQTFTYSYGSQGYAAGNGPQFDDSYIPLDYQESNQKISVPSCLSPVSFDSSFISG